MLDATVHTLIPTHTCVHTQLKVQNIVEVYAFVVLNILAMAYACLQVYQFRGFGRSCVLITEVGYVALANVSVIYHNLKCYSV